LEGEAKTGSLEVTLKGNEDVSTIADFEDEDLIEGKAGRDEWDCGVADEDGDVDGDGFLRTETTLYGTDKYKVLLIHFTLLD
jgi:hypothetical protein